MPSLNRINQVNLSAMQKTPAVIKKDKEIAGTTFAEKFEKIKSDDVKEHLQKIYDKIVDQSEKLGDRLYIKDLVDYKKLVTEFMDVAVKNSHAFSKENFLDRRGRHRVLSQVKQVDRHLASLTQDFLGQEVDRISVLRKLDDIRGILLDMFM
ncbi:MAG: YaaR family protein [Marinisporobacter sp.]|nr:YaaR family protein [Marinisporobacter sp.]